MNKKGIYAVPVVLLFLAIVMVLFIVLVYPSERAKMLQYGNEAGSYSIKITDEGFYPSELEVPAGARVSWINTDNTMHTITFLDSKSNNIYKGGSYSRVFSETGSYTYTSDYKPGYKGTITVR